MQRRHLQPHLPARRRSSLGAISDAWRTARELGPDAYLQPWITCRGGSLKKLNGPHVFAAAVNSDSAVESWYLLTLTLIGWRSPGGVDGGHGVLRAAHPWRTHGVVAPGRSGMPPHGRVVARPASSHCARWTVWVAAMILGGRRAAVDVLGAPVDVVDPRRPIIIGTDQPAGRRQNHRRG